MKEKQTFTFFFPEAIITEIDHCHHGVHSTTTRNGDNTTYKVTVV